MSKLWYALSVKDEQVILDSGLSLVVLYTGTQLYRNTSLVPSISDPVFPLLSFRYSFRYIFSQNTLKCIKSTSFAVNKVANLNINFCFVLNWTCPRFCAGARLSQRVRIQEISTWEDVEEGILTGLCPIKQCFCCN